MIVEYRQADASVKVFGYMMSDGPLSAATGRMVRGWHGKCWYVSKKREAKGDAVSGRVMPGGPTGYDVDEEQARERSIAQVTARLARLRELAQSMGRSVGDAQVQEAMLADEHGGPYAHQHQHRLETYQLIAHLQYAHGIRDRTLLAGSGSLQDQHVELHARQSQAAILADRVADDEHDLPVRDWRTQLTADLPQGETR